MIKQDIVEKISQKGELPVEIVSKVVSLFTVIIAAACMRGDKVTLRGFGTFEMVTHKGRTVRNPRGQRYYVPERSVCKFRPGKMLYIDKPSDKM